ncbi:MAG: hypothetical protein IGS48_13355 [Oscillatoriales cyanobacterium C42_A2020_001]|nr:hypothetical protein [Leptolyngbyaceae cyanobacterium C42_A2020_001]
MKRLLASVISTLVLSTLVAPNAQAIRPELLPERMHPTFSNEAAVKQESIQRVEVKKEQATKPAQTPNVEMEQPASNTPSFVDFERIYLDKFGS